MFQVRLFRTWRRAAVVALVGVAAIATPLVVVAPAQAAAPTITIAATSRFKPLTNDVYVVYHDGTYSNATIHGTISGAKAGEVAILFAQQFPFTKSPVRLGSRTLRAAASTYSFTVTPTLYTKYAVRVFANTTATQRLATSGVQNVYVTAGSPVTNAQPCARPVRKETFHAYTVLPSSALSVEMGKHWYPTSASTSRRSSNPPPPTWLYLNAGHASVSAARRINAGEFENTFTFTFTIGNEGYHWAWIACTKDTVSRDGLGLPGYHGCGAGRVPRTVAYLG